SHGGGELRETYTAQLEDLASHGYAVAAITHTYDSALAIFPDGRHVVLAPKRWPPATTSTIEGLPLSEEANPERLQWWADDIRFVLAKNLRAPAKQGNNRRRFVAAVGVTLKNGL